MSSINIESKIKIISRRKISDNRGWFLKIIDGKENSLPNYTGEIYIVSAISGNLVEDIIIIERLNGLLWLRETLF